MSQGQDSLRATDTIYMFPFNGMIQPGCCPCVTCATVPCCTSRWSAMDLLWWAHLFPHEDDVAVVALLGVWEGPAPPALYQQLAQWNTNILPRTATAPSCHHVMRWRWKAWCLDTRGFILKKIQWHIYVGSWSLVNCWQEALTRHYIRCSLILMRAAVGLMEWPWPW